MINPKAGSEWVINKLVNNVYKSLNFKASFKKPLMSKDAQKIMKKIPIYWKISGTYKF